jgi:hypothetical protein
MAFDSEIEAVSRAGVFQLWCAIDEKDSVVNVVFFAEFGNEPTRNNVRSRWFKCCMQQFVCVGIDGSVQPVLLVIELDHGLVNRNVIRALSFFGL